MRRSENRLHFEAALTHKTNETAGEEQQRVCRVMLIHRARHLTSLTLEVHANYLC